MTRKEKIDLVNTFYSRLKRVFDGDGNFMEYWKMQVDYERDHRKFAGGETTVSVTVCARYFAVRDVFRAIKGINRPTPEEFFVIKKTIFAAYALVGKKPTIHGEFLMSEINSFLTLECVSLIA